jgi:hypothetical protein
MDTPTTALMDAMDSMRVAKTIAERRNHYNTAIRALGERSSTALARRTGRSRPLGSTLRKPSLSPRAAIRRM